MGCVNWCGVHVTSAPRACAYYSLSRVLMELSGIARTPRIDTRSIKISRQREISVSHEFQPL